MKYQVSFLILICLQMGCGVELRDKNQNAQEVSELRVVNEYTLPVPMIMSEQVVLHYDRLILNAKSRLITQGLNVRIVVKELISEGGEILTFKPDQYASVGENGRRGGNLEIIAEHATGDLDIVMQGEHGGKGSDGAPPDEALRGPKGAQGRRALYSSWAGTTFCTDKAKNGDPGGQGLQGYPGGNGFRGGDSGSALVKIASGENFKVRFEKRPGQGGSGGTGGAGGPGGYGGEPGIETLPSYNGPPVHYYAVAGPQGASGPQGNSGKSGVAGNIEKVCIEIGSTEIHCE